MRMIFLKKKVNSFDYDLQRTCKNCEQVFKGRFCNTCGEKVFEPHEKTVKYFLSHIFNAFTFLDGKFWNSFRTMIIHPGRMAKDISLGKRQPYMRLVSFFFVGNVIYFLFPIFETFNSSLYSQMDYMSYSKVLSIHELIESKYITEDMSMDEFARQYQVISTGLSKTCLIIWVTILSLLFFGVNFTKEKLFSDHLIFTLEFASFFLIGLTIILGLFLYTFWKVTGLNYLSDSVAVFIFVPLILYHLFRGIKVFYERSNLGSAVRSVLCLIVLIVSVDLYRLFLLVVTLYQF